MSYKLDKRNYRKHNDRNKMVIRKSLQELGAGRSIVVDSEGEIIAGNGVYEQAQKLGLPVREIETDGSELVVVKRTDLATGDEKRKQLALADNAASDLSDWDEDLMREDWSEAVLQGWGVVLPSEKETQEELEMTEYEAEQILEPQEEYLLIKCRPENYDAMREFFRAGFVRPVEQGRRHAEKMEKARVIQFERYVDSNTKQEPPLQEQD